jgi:hypothetical protein
MCYHWKIGIFENFPKKSAENREKWPPHHMVTKIMRPLYTYKTIYGVKMLYKIIEISKLEKFQNFVIFKTILFFPFRGRNFQNLPK